jgi:CheY-like chemotaxis protein
MRIIDGFEFLKVIKGEEKFRNIPIIVYSTSSKKEDENLSLSLGAVNYFTKPKTTHGMQEVVEIFASYFNTEPLINTTSG